MRPHSGMTQPPFLMAVCALCIAVALQDAQAQASTGDARRAIEDSTASSTRLSIQKPGKADHDLSPRIDHLAGVEVVGPSALAGLVKTYWLRFLGKPVDGDALLDFKTWFAQESRKNGALAFALAESKAAPEGGQTLVLTLISPKIKSSELRFSDAAMDAAYREVLAARLADYFSAQAVLDIDGLDQHLERICFDLPLNLEATVKPVGPELVEVLVSASPVEHKPGKLQRLMIQINNHGLKQFGREQVLGLLSVSGLGLASSAHVAALASEGIQFISAEHEALAPGFSGRARVFASYSGSKSLQAGDAATQGTSTEFGLGLARQEHSFGDLLLRSHTEWVSRHSVNRLQISNVNTSDIKDEQFRFSLTLDNERVRRFPMAVNITAASGHLSPSSFDTIAGGRYYKLNARANFSHPISLDGRWWGVFKAQSQWASRNLDSYNKISVGGNQGVRAYTSADGVGDRGAVGSFEINHLHHDGLMAGVFFDAGRIHPHKTPQAGAFNHAYTLQAVGLHFGGHWNHFKFDGHIGKGLGGYRLAEFQSSAAESQANPLKFALAVSVSF